MRIDDKATRLVRVSIATALVLLASDTTTHAQRGRGVVRSTSRSSVHSPNVNVSRNVNRDHRNIDIDRDFDIDRDVDIDIDRDWCCYRGLGTAAAVATTAAVTAAAIGSVTYTLPPSCSVVMVNGFTYQQCGSVWYQPQITSGSTTYVVVNPPR